MQIMTFIATLEGQVKPDVRWDSNQISFGNRDDIFTQLYEFVKFQGTLVDTSGPKNEVREMMLRDTIVSIIFRG